MPGVIKSKKLLVHLLFLLVLPCISSECGYRLVGKGISLPEQYWMMTVPIFENKTAQQDIEQTITLAVLDELSSLGELKIVSEEKANAILMGSITNYREQPQNISANQRAKSYRIFISANVSLIDSKTKSIYWQDKNLILSQDYDVSNYVGQIEFEQEEARKLAAEDFAERLTSVLLEGF